MASIVTTLTNDQYRAQRGYSKSDLDLVHRSPALLEWARNAPRSASATADIGTATHAALLEPELFAEQYRQAPSFDKRTKAGKEGAEAFEASMAGSGKVLLSSDDYELVTAMRDSVLAHPVARDLLTSPGVSEASIFWELDGLKLKCRPDRMVDDRHILVDLKTTASIDKFAMSVEDFRYHIQAALYSDGALALTGHQHRFIFVVVEKVLTFGRHRVEVVELEPEWVEAGRREYLEDLEAVRELESFGCGMHVRELKRPYWASKK